jgi:hypothetical protein
MQVTEQNKQEADKIIEDKYSIIKKTDTCLHEEACPNLVGCQLSKYGCDGWEKVSIELAIQDRQSVLEAMQQLLEHLQMSSKFAIQLRITNLTEQIEYLKSKL